MKRLPQISEAEYEVMKVIWKDAPVSTNEVTEKLTRTTEWSPKTIQTMLKRLVNKGALTYVKEGRVFVYSPLVEEEEYVSQKSSSFLSRYYDGARWSLLISKMTGFRTTRSIHSGAFWIKALTEKKNKPCSNGLFLRSRILYFLSYISPRDLSIYTQPVTVKALNIVVSITVLEVRTPSCPIFLAMT